MQRVKKHNWTENTIVKLDDLIVTAMVTDLGDGYVAHVVKHGGPRMFRVKLFHDGKCILVSCDYSRENYDAACRDALMIIRDHIDKQRVVLEEQLDHLHSWLYEEV